MKTSEPQEATTFRKDGDLVRRMKEGLLAPHNIVGLVGVGEVMKVAVLEGQQMIEAALPAALASKLQFLLADVDAGNLTTKVCRQVASRGPVTTTQIQDAHAGAQRRGGSHHLIGVFHVLGMGTFFATGDAEVQVIAPHRPVDFIRRAVIVSFGGGNDGCRVSFVHGAGLLV